MAHDKYSPSQLYRLIACPGSYNLCKDLPQKTSIYAEEGTAAHEIAAQFLEFQHLGKNKRPACPPEMAESVQLYTDYVALVLKANPEAGLKVEHHVNLNGWIDGVGGTADVIIEVPFEKIEIIDLKYGAGVGVDVEDNPQLMCYGLSASYNQLFEKVKITIVQPRFDHSDGPIRSVEMDYRDLLRWGRDVLEPAIAKIEKSTELNPGKKQCQFCLAAGICPAQYNKTLEMAKVDFMPTRKKYLPLVSTLTPEQISDALTASSFFADWVKQLNAHAHDMLARGEIVPGYKLVKKRANRKWIDDNAVIKKFDSAEIFEKKLLSPAQLEKIVGKNEVAGLWESPENGTTIAHESDKRAAVTLSAADDFKNV